jgi:hypothetical protein
MAASRAPAVLVSSRVEVPILVAAHLVAIDRSSAPSTRASVRLNLDPPICCRDSVFVGAAVVVQGVGSSRAVLVRSVLVARVHLRLLGSRSGWRRRCMRAFSFSIPAGCQVSSGIARRCVSALRKSSAHGHRFGNRSRCVPLRFTIRPGSAMSRVRIVRATVG